MRSPLSSLARRTGRKRCVEALEIMREEALRSPLSRGNSTHLRRLVNLATFIASKKRGTQATEDHRSADVSVLRWAVTVLGLVGAEDRGF